jgi:hypothetical protein
MAEIKYAEKTNFDSLGRSGFTQCHGIAVTNLHPEVFLEAISSRGTISPVRIVVPLASVAALRDALTAILAEPATISERHIGMVLGLPDVDVATWRTHSAATARSVSSMKPTNGSNRTIGGRS